MLSATYRRKPPRCAVGTTRRARPRPRTLRYLPQAPVLKNHRNPRNRQQTHRLWKGGTPRIGLLQYDTVQHSTEETRLKKAVGIGGSIHDFSACIIDERREIFAIEDERLNRIRYALGASHPCELSLKYCLALSTSILD